MVYKSMISEVITMPVSTTTSELQEKMQQLQKSKRDLFRSPLSPSINASLSPISNSTDDTNSNTSAVFQQDPLSKIKQDREGIFIKTLLHTPRIYVWMIN